MNLDLAKARELAAGLVAGMPKGANVDVAICPPAIYLFPMAKAISGSDVKLGAQNCWNEDSGAFTGEVSPDMVKETGCSYVILGHSERRNTIGPKDGNGKIWGESNEMIAAKARAVIDRGLTAIVCVGELLDQRDAGQTEAVLTEQLSGSLANLAAADCDRLVIAYEPVWAIGTGRVATPDQAQAAHAHIRSRLAAQFDPARAGEIRIQYGGSVKPDNAAELMVCPDVDGALVGGASLKANDFLKIIEAAAASAA